MAKKKEEEEDLKDASFNMKKYFKTPEDITKVGFKTYRDKRLKATINKGLINAPFLYITNFKFDGNNGVEELPMLFIGDINSFWKKAINTDYKKRKEFAQGICTLQQDDSGNRKLVLDVQKGKGKREANLKLINKSLFKKLGISAEYLGKKAGTKEDELEEKIAHIGDEVVSQSTSVFGRIKQEIARLQKMSPEDMEQRVHQIALITALIGEWNLTYKGHKSERKDEAKQIKKLQAYLKEASKKYNKTNLNIQLLDSLKDDLKSYLISRNDFLSNVKVYQKDGTEHDKLKELWTELQMIKSNISDWKVANPKPQKDEIKTINQIEARVKMEEKDLLRWLKKAKIDVKSIDTYQHKVDEKKAEDARQLEVLGAMTVLPKISKPTLASSTFKKLYKAYQEYSSIDRQEIEMRKIKLLEITAYVNQWEQEWKSKSSLKKKLGNGKKEEAEVIKIKKDLVVILEAINTFTQDRDNYVEISNAYRDFQKLTTDYKPSPENEDKVSYLMDNLNYMIEEWQMHYTNISSFGTKKKNKKLESIRKEMAAFVKKQGANKQSEDTSAIVEQLSKKTADANALELEELEKNEKEKFYADPENKKKAEEINKERELINKKEKELTEALKTDKSAENLNAVNNLKFEKNNLDQRELELEKPIRDVLSKKEIELANNLSNEKVSLIQKIAASVAAQLSESADNGEFSSQLFDVREQLITYARIIKNPKRSSPEDLAKAKETYKKLKKEEETLEARAVKEALPKIKALAKHLAEQLATKHNLNAEQLHEVLLKLDDQTVYIANNLDSDAKKLCDTTAKGILNDPHFNLEDINASIKDKLTYSYDNDKELKNIAKETATIEGIKATDHKKRTKHLQDWFKMTGIWESKIGDYYPSPELNKAIKELKAHKATIRPFKEETKHVEDLLDVEKKIKVLKANQKKLKEQAAEAKKKLATAKDKDKAALVKKMNDKNAAYIETTLKLKAYSDEWEGHFDKITDGPFTSKKADRRKKILDGAETFEKQLKALNDKGKIDEKHNLALGIIEKYKKTDIQYKEDDNEVIAEAKQGNVKEILDLIIDWETISVVLLEEEELKVHGKDADQIKIIRDALLQEQYRFENKVTIYADPVYDTIQKQVNKLHLDQLIKNNKVVDEKVTADIIKQFFALDKLITAWKKAHPESDANHIKQYEYINELAPKVEKIKMSDGGVLSIDQENFQIRVDELKARLEEYKKINANPDSSPIPVSEEDVKALQGIFDKGTKEASDLLAVPQSAHKKLDKVETDFTVFEKDMLAKIHEENQKEEAKILSLLEGCDSYDKIKDILSKEKQTQIENACARAVERAKLIITAGGSSEEAERMLEHIPIAFWPDEFLEEMRLWRKAEQLYFQQKEEQAKAEFIDSGLKQFLMDAKTAITEPMNAYNAVMKSGKYNMDVVGPDGKTQKMSFNILEPQKEGTVVDPNGKPMSGTTIAGNVLSSALDAKSAIMSIKSLIEDNNDDPEAIRKRQVMIGRVIADTTQKICNNATKFINTSASNVPGPKIATAVLKSVSILTGLILKSTDGMDDPVLAKEHFKEMFSPENAGEIVETLLNVGAGISEIVGLFNSVGGVVGSAFGVAVNIKALIDSAKKLHAAVQAKNEMRTVQDRAVREDSVMLHAIRREMKTCKEDVAKEAVNVTGDSLKVIGSGVATVGGVVALGHPGAGAGVTVGGKIIEKTGDAIKIGGKIVFAIRDDQTKKKVKKLIKAAKTDRNARMELLENSKFFAKAFLAAGLEEGDPIAQHYCLVKGLTEDDLNHEATAHSVLQKLIADDPSTLDDKTIGDKIQDLGNNIKNFVTKYTRLDKVELDLDINHVKELRPSVKNIISNYKLLEKVNTGTTIATILSALVGISPLVDIADEELREYIDDCYQNFKNLKKQLNDQSVAQDSQIKTIIGEVNTLNIDINDDIDTDLLLKKVDEIAKKEEEMRLKKLFIQEARESDKLFIDIGLK